MQAPTRSGRKRKVTERVAAAIEDEAASREEKRLANTARLARARDEALRRAEKAAKKARDDDARHKVEVVKAWRGVMQQLISQPVVVPIYLSCQGSRRSRDDVALSVRPPQPKMFNGRLKE